jgi:hypothetical protein
MSTISALACTTFFDRLISARASTRASGTEATPMLVSVVE